MSNSQKSASGQARPRTLAQSRDTNRQRAASGSDKNLELASQMNRMRATLQALLRDNAFLRRELSQVKLENERLRATERLERAARRGPTAADRVRLARTMLRDRSSRNP
jgi:hypothetical protein